ncbi:MAG: ABC transporter permease [Anaerolineae bacterium]|nr:ABC transporter permease [Anaerolineae bacterium]
MKREGLREPVFPSPLDGGKGRVRGFSSLVVVLEAWRIQVAEYIPAGNASRPPQNDTPDQVARASSWQVIRSLLLRAGPLVALFVLCLFLASATPHFLTQGNLVNVARRTSTIAIFAIGQTFVILTGGIDLSVGAVGALAASVAAVTMTQRITIAGLEIGPIGFIEGFLLALVIGLLAGMINGLLVTKGRIPDFIATLGTLEMFRGVALLVTDGLPIPSHLTATELKGYLPEQMIAMGSGDVLGIPIAAIIALSIAALAFIVLRYTAIGRAIFAVGGNKEAARVSGISVERTKMAVYMISGLLAAIAGFVLAGRLNSANALMAGEDNLNSIAAVVIGGTNLFGGEGGVIGSVIGAVITGVLSNGLNLLDVSAFYQRIVQGAVIVSVVIFDQWRRRRFGS